MAATGKTPILLYGSTTPTNAPTAGNLNNSSDGCEIAINVADKNLFFKDSSNNVNTVPIRQSSASSNGWLSSTDWSTFNGKQPAGTYVTSVTGTAPVVSSGGTTPAISMAAATSSVNGYLTSTDWTTFNGKQAALVSGSNIKTVSGTSLLGSGDLGTIGTGYGGTGLTSFTANGVPYASSTSALTVGSLLQFNGIGVGIGGAAVSDRALHTRKNGNIQLDYDYGTAGTSFRVLGDATPANGVTFVSEFYGSGSYGPFKFKVNNADHTQMLANGNLNVSVGNLVIGTSGKGIDFSATAGTGTSELLADYEEGTFTPVFTCETPGNLSITYSNQVGRYTKIGNRVECSIAITTTAFTHSTASGRVAITGLPYAANATSQVYGVGNITGEGITKAGYTQFNAVANTGAAYMFIWGFGSGASFYQLVIGDFPSGAQKYLYISCQYEV